MVPGEHMRIWTATISRLCGVALGIVVASIPLLAAKPSPTPTPAPESAPVPAEIFTAKTVFISHAGVDAASVAFFQRTQDADAPYNLFYAAMKQWGRFGLVSNPSDADLVFEIRFMGSRFELTILDAKTHFILWTFFEPVEFAALQSHRNKNFDQAMAMLVDDIKSLAGRFPSPAAGANQ
jgi:hypothetical protein